MATLKGIDISNWQRGIDLSKVEADFIIAKATEGVGYVDPCCDGFIQQALKLKKLIGFYHFARPENDAIKEAEFFYNNTKGYFKKGIPVLDWEAERISDTAWAKRWLDKVYALSGVRPMIYMSESVVNAYDWSSVAKDYGLWVAKYADNAIDKNYSMANAGTKPSVRYWDFYAMWQWTSSGKLDGYSGNLDCNIFYGDKNAWNKYAGTTTKTTTDKTIEKTANKTTNTTKKTTSKKSIETIAKEVIKGKWGNGWNRKTALEAAGYDYDKVQAQVNKIMASKVLKVGVKVKIKQGAHQYGSTALFAAQVYKTVYKVVEIMGNRVVFATTTNNVVIGAVAKSDCIVQ